jgi:hypothetical protein
MTPKYVAVIPSIYQPYTNACIASCRLDNVTVVDNTRVNKGVAASWNIGVREMYATGADWTIIISASVRFGKAGGLDLVQAMDEYPDALVVEAGTYDMTHTTSNTPPTRWDENGTPLDGFGWHLLAIHRRTFDDVGLFDENIWPAYMEDTDWNHRCKVFYTDIDWSRAPYWPRVPVDGIVAYVGHGVDLGRVNIQRGGQMDYYKRKWGGEPHHEWEHPFNDPNNPVSFWPEPAPRDMSHRRGRR